MKREIRLNAFEMNCITHQSPGLWRHPRDRAWQYKDLDYWTDLARILEGGKFDAIFIADVLGVYDVLDGNADAAARQAVQIPVNDPLQLVPAMATVTRDLGFGLTASVSFEHPYPFARRLSTLDHLTKGRAAWNVVTSSLESGAKNIGLIGQVDHDERYEIAEEYLEVCYELWEGSWEDGAVLRDRACGIFVDPAKVHPIRHKGRYFDTPGVHLCEPSPQRTPLLFQAGSSPRGKRFAGKHAECVFVSQPSKAALKKSVVSIRAAATGRQSSAVKIFNMQTVIVDETDAKAQAKYKEYRDYVSPEGALALLSGWLGCDFGAYEPDTPLSSVNAKSVQSSLEAYAAIDGGGLKTVRDLAEWVGVGGFGPLFAGSPSTVADLLQEWVEETDVDGFNLTYAVAHETFADVAGFLVPELQRRGVFKRDYARRLSREAIWRWRPPWRRSPRGPTSKSGASGFRHGSHLSAVILSNLEGSGVPGKRQDRRLPSRRAVYETRRDWTWLHQPHAGARSASVSARPGPPAIRASRNRVTSILLQSGSSWGSSQ